MSVGLSNIPATVKLGIFFEGSKRTRSSSSSSSSGINSNIRTLYGNTTIFKQCSTITRIYDELSDEYRIIEIQ